jgi:hypothetical protein
MADLERLQTGSFYQPARTCRASAFINKRTVEVSKVLNERQWLSKYAPVLTDPNAKASLEGAAHPLQFSKAALDSNALRRNIIHQQPTRMINPYSFHKLCWSFFQVSLEATRKRACVHPSGVSQGIEGPVQMRVGHNLFNETCQRIVARKLPSKMQGILALAASTAQLDD